MDIGRVTSIDSCTKCKRVLKEDWGFCPYCRTPVESDNCPYCREKVKKKWKYCPFCKNEIKGVGKTREDSNEWLSTILEK